MKPRKLLFILSLLWLLLGAAVQADTAFQLTHIVQPGETLLRIALQYGVDLNALAAANGIANSHLIYTAQELTIPSPSAPATVRPSPRTHTVRAGDILGEIAKQYDVGLQELRALNGITNSRIYPGDVLLIPGASTAAAPAAPVHSPAPNTTSSAPAPNTAGSAPNRLTHIVQRGETLGTIAQRYAVALADLMSVNGISDPDRIDVGQELQVWVSNAMAEHVRYQPREAVITPPPAPTPAERQQYLVQPNEYLSQIGRDLGISWLAIADLNGITDPNTVLPGTTLLIPNSDDLASYQSGLLNYHNFDSAHPGARVGVGRELVVVLGTQMAYAYEDGALVRRARVSTGLPDTPTVQGNFTIKRKLRTTTMSGPDYHLENVEWVMYFYAGYGFHGTYWHNNFGRPMSHGCVNMTNEDAQWFYEFASIGTPVHVRP